MLEFTNMVNLTSHIDFENDKCDLLGLIKDFKSPQVFSKLWI